MTRTFETMHFELSFVSRSRMEMITRPVPITILKFEKNVDRFYRIDKSVKETRLDNAIENLT